MHFAEKDKTYFWKTWGFTSRSGRQRWHFVLPEELLEVVKTEEDWQKPEAQEFLHAFDQAFIFDKKVNPNSADRVFRFLRSQEAEAPSLESLHPGQVKGLLLLDFEGSEIRD